MGDEWSDASKQQLQILHLVWLRCKQHLSRHCLDSFKGTVFVHIYRLQEHQAENDQKAQQLRNSTNPRLCNKWKVYNHS